VREQLQRHIALLDEQIDQIKHHIQDHLHQHPDLRQQKELLTSIPGIGDLTAAKLLAQIPNIRAFDDPRQLVAFAGLNPSQHQSGNSRRSKTPISKQGHACLRAALYMPAISAKQHNPLLRAFALRLSQRGLSGLEIVVAVMRKLLHLVYGILKSGLPFDPLYLSPGALSD
jgi:transposase